MAFIRVAVIKFHGHLVFILILLWLQATASLMVVSSSYNISKPGCRDKCGDISIPYPFGMGDENCFFDRYFNITCNETFNPPKATFYGSDRELLGIGLHGQLRANSFIAFDCYDKISSDFFEERFPFSNNNKFVAIGCDTVAYIRGDNYTSGCISSCKSINDVINGSCTGIGCCQAFIPTGLITSYKIELTAKNNRSTTWDFNPCSYAFLVEENWFNFSSLDLYDNQNRSGVPVVIDWTVGYVTCEQAKQGMAVNYTCGVNSYCYNPSNGYGYGCRCLDGYEGNPYLINGCQDINECDKSREILCAPEALCTNTVGNYTCSCPSGYYGDGTKQGIGCRHQKRKFATIVPFGIGIGIMVVLLLGFGFFWLYRRLQERKQIKLKQHYFNKMVACY